MTTAGVLDGVYRTTRVNKRSFQAKQNVNFITDETNEKNQYYDAIKMDDEMQTKEEVELTQLPKEETKDTAKMYSTMTDLMPFAFLQNTVISIIKEWSNTEEARHHTFYKTWKEWKKKIDEDSTFNEVLSPTNMFDLWEYMNYLNDCPAIQQRLILTWDMDAGSINWSKARRKK
jgi:hypothetical protein